MLRARPNVAGTRLFRAQMTTIIVLFTVAVYGSIFLVTRASLIDSLRSQAAAYLDLVITMRQWNALHGAVWVPRDADTQPNPFLDELGVESNVMTSDGKELVLRNPAAMTREISELTAAGNGVVFRLVGEDPLNPANEPDDWETEALRTIGSGRPWAETFDRSDRERPVFRYITPLRVESACMTCHTASDGYSIGVAKGGLSVSIPASDFDSQIRRAGSVLGTLTVLTLVISLTTLSLMLYRLNTRLAEAGEELRILATTDPLTGMPNRRATLERLAEEFERSRRTASPLSVVTFDLDHFKRVNDEFGHATGDCALRRFVERVNSATRPYDVFGRIGGEEFLLIAPGTGIDEATALAERILDAVRKEPCPCEDGGVALTASAGVAGITSGEQTAENLLVRADRALYRAKDAGRDQVAVDRS